MPSDVMISSVTVAVVMRKLPDFESTVSTVIFPCKEPVEDMDAYLKGEAEKHIAAFKKLLAEFTRAKWSVIIMDIPADICAIPVYRYP